MSFGHISSLLEKCVLSRLSNGDNLHEMSSPVSWGKIRKKISKCLLKILPRMLSISRQANLYIPFLYHEVTFYLKGLFGS